MTQDTRKDRRVKIVSLNVRYKSATVDEFIENHAHDVSRGGIYIKTGSPFPPGTLLKFEIRLASDQAVITGVGRVVWKRDTTQGTGERPAGMGVKFIKIDDPSKTVIDRLVNSRSDAGRSYESESETGNVEVPAPTARPPSTRPVANRIGKSTMLGIGAVAGAGPARPTTARPAGSVPPRPSTGGGGMFPASVPEDDAAPKQEQTVMKQAAELLEEALREAGGTMEDVGTNPLFAGPPAASSKVEVKPPSVAPLESPEAAAEAARARAMVAGMSPGQPKRALSDPPRTSRESPVAKLPERVEPRAASGRPSGRPAIASAPPRPPKKGSGGTVVILVVAAAAAALGVVYRGAIFGEPAAPSVPSAAQAVTPPPAPSASAAPAASEAPAVASAEPGASASAVASASAPPSASAAPPASASAAPAVSASAAPAVHAAAPRPKPAAAPAPAAATAAATAHDD
ncbi:MAG TPA: TIGR02266 family protein, partial [Polyangiaceae bacterium]|nr:TIGR02266 family protein [Polyangiaceae bacterium]